jgi:hypothetical protein
MNVMQESGGIPPLMLIAYSFAPGPGLMAVIVGQGSDPPTQPTTTLSGAGGGTGAPLKVT